MPDQPPLEPQVPLHPAIRSVATPLWAVFALTFANSLGSGVVTTGIVFLTKHGYKFSTQMNYLLAVVLGVTYIAGALGAQPLMGLLRRTFPGLSSRGFLTALMLVMAGLCTIPWLALKTGGDTPLEQQTPWAVWVLVVIYSPLTGMLWPMVESYLSGGRSGHTLRKVTSRWNVCWSSAIAAAYFGIAHFVESWPTETILCLGLVHIASLAILTTFAREPAPHDTSAHEPHPPVYIKLLATFRLLLPLSYVVSSALGPYLPEVMTHLKIEAGHQTLFAAASLVARTCMFFVLATWSGWHGRWFPAIIGGILLLTGFAGVVLADKAGSREMGISLLVGGLGMFGTGMATIYSGALYYALEVGQSEVQAGGKHEALIGVGYTIGPFLFLASSTAASRELISEQSIEGWVLGAVIVIATGVAAAVIHKVLRHAKAA